ncbi:MAG: hypothetical protein N3D84_00090 [Candidatus Woesearchaeota archaeon]|nr:hypothetical protein [Candidatus Woesearchaeota archaeon]
MKSKTEEKIIRAISIAGFSLFFVWGFITLFLGNKELVFDRFYSAAIMLVGYFFYRKLHLKIKSVLFGGFVLFLHHLKLYGNVYFGIIQFDMIMHFLAGIALAVILYDCLSFGRSKKESAMLAFFVAIGICSLSEIMEYIGYYFLGPGEGLLFYGTGDFGEYADVCWDMICNSIGALVGVLAAMLLDLRKSK